MPRKEKLMAKGSLGVKSVSDRKLERQAYNSTAYWDLIRVYKERVKFKSVATHDAVGLDK